MGNRVYAVESVTGKELRLLETQTAYPTRHVLIPTDSFTIDRKFPFAVHPQTSDTVYNSTAGIEPIYKQDNFVQVVLTGISGTASFEFDYIVQKDGTIGDVTIKYSSNPTLNKKFVQMVKKTSGTWIPTVIEGKTVNVKCSTRVWRQSGY
jgi:hypothetical protein